MRLEVAAWKSGFLWRRTDDVRPSCVSQQVVCTAEVLFCGHYGLVVCTEENSAYTTLRQCPQNK